MSDRSREAAEKYAIKLRDENYAKEIMKGQAGDKMGSIFSLFENAVKEFNTDSKGNVLKFSHTPGNEYFHVLLNGSGVQLVISLNYAMRKIQVSGANGLKYSEDIFVKPDIRQGNAFFADHKGDSIDIDDSVWKSLYALLEI